MQKKRPSSSSLLIGLVAGVLPLQAAAIEFGPAPQSIALSQPLDFSVPLRLEPGESISPDCVIADVTLGDKQVPRPLVRGRLERVDARSAIVRATSSLTVDEPMVFIELSVGCPVRLTRRFVVLADPALGSTAPAPPVSLPVTEPARDIPLQAPERPAAASAARKAEATPPASRPPVQRSLKSQEPSPVAAPPRTETASRQPRTRTPDPAVSAPNVSHLKMDVVDPPQRPAKPLAQIVEEAMQAIEAVAQSAGAASAVPSAASSASVRIAALEKTMAELHRDSQAQRDLMLQMQTQLMAAESASRWVMPLSVMLVGLAGLAGWLAWRMRQMQRPGRPAGQATSAPSAMNPALADGDAISLPPNYDSTSPPNGSLTAGSPRDVSIEELIDLEQQAEFFIALGQEESAVELLTDHLRNNEGGSPLAYLKLLEIYKRRDDRAAYERIRLGFNQLFNAYAPVWEADLQAGLPLENYTDVVQQLQTVWSRPVTAMAELGKLIFHSQHGDVFDLPAYRDVLFLYALARDLADRGVSPLPRIDLVPQPQEVVEFRGTEQHDDLDHDDFSAIEVSDSKLPTTLVDLDLHLDLDLDMESTIATVIPTPSDSDLNFDLDLDLDLDHQDLSAPRRQTRGE